LNLTPEQVSFLDENKNVRVKVIILNAGLLTAETNDELVIDNVHFNVLVYLKEGS